MSSSIVRRRLGAIAGAIALVLLVGVGPAMATAPPRIDAPSVAFDLGGTATATSVPVVIRWGRQTDSGAIAGYRLKVSRSGGPWRAIRLRSLHARSAHVALVTGSTYRFAVTAAGSGGSISRMSLPVAASLDSETSAEIRYTGTWISTGYAGYIGGGASTTVDPGARATWTGTALAIALLATRGPTRGVADLKLDGSGAGSVTLTDPARSFGRVVAERSFSSDGHHAFGLTARRGTIPRIDLDGVAVLRTVAPAPLLAVGDIAVCNLGGDELTADLATAWPGAIALLGDLAYPAGSAADFTNCFAPSWGPLVPRTYPVPGNHEYLTAHAAAYFAYFAAQAGDPAKGWYSYDLGTWRVYALNSNCSAIGGCGPASAQYRWLKASLAAHPRACSLAYWHHPRFSSGFHGNDPLMAPIWGLLAAHGADIALAGHEHDYERLAPADAAGRRLASGIREFIVGTGGATRRRFHRSPLSITSYRKDGVWGLLSLRLGVGDYGWKFLEAGSGAVLDAGTSTCR